MYNVLCQSSQWLPYTINRSISISISMSIHSTTSTNTTTTTSSTSTNSFHMPHQSIIPIMLHGNNKKCNWKQD